MQKANEKIFKKGSRTYYYSSLFFPARVKRDVFSLYAFVRVVDDMVDTVPPKKREFAEYVGKLEKTFESGKKSGEPIIDGFVALCNKYSFDRKWVDAFVNTMKNDLRGVKMQTIDDTKNYMYGSAEVIGLMMSKILDLPEKSHKHAQILGRAMQYANMIRDIDEDNSLGRVYIPLSHVRSHGLSSLSRSEISRRKNEFSRLIRQEITLYRKWQAQAEKGFEYVPKRYLIPIKTASDMYGWTMKQIYKNPSIVFEKKVKPSKTRIVLAIAKNAISLGSFK